MPPKVNFTRERVLQQAFEIVRKEGMDALSARKIAQQLQCSTRPVYTAFQSMKALQKAVVQNAREYALRYFLSDSDKGDAPFIHLGIQYFRFSQEERELFDLLFIKGEMGITFENAGQPFAPLLDRMKNDPRLAGCNETGLKRLGFNMWIYAHGLILLIKNDPPFNAEELVCSYLLRMGEAFIKQELG